MTQVRDFAAASRVTRAEDGLDGRRRFAIEVPDGWQTGRGAFGGLGIGCAIRALEAMAPGLPLRALTAELPGPLLVGPAHVDVTVLRIGSALSSLEAVIAQEGEARVRATGLFGPARGDDRRWAPEPPAMPDWRNTPAAPLGALPPPFARFFEYRVTGPAAFGGGTEPIASGWIRPLEPLETWGAAEVAALADCYWPALFATQTSFRPMATLTYTLQLTEVAHRLRTDAPLFYRARAIAGDAGFVSELRELWTERGELVALNPQTFVVIK